MNMTAEDRIAFKAYVRDIGQRMELWQWTIRVDDEPTLDAHAQVKAIKGTWRAILQFKYDTRDESKEEIRNTVVHELLHLHLTNAQHVIDFDMVPWLRMPGDHEFLSEIFRRQLEYAVDGIAGFVAPLMPLIEWPSDRTKTVLDSEPKEADNGDDGATGNVL